MSFRNLMLGFSTFHVQDDFLADPDALREELLSAERFIRGDDANFSGYALPLSPEWRQNIKERLEAAIGYRIDSKQERDMDLSARLSKRGDERLARSMVHCDLHPFTAVLYLTPDRYVPDGINYGTRRWETREHGIDTVTYDVLKPSLKSRWTEDEFKPRAEECIRETFNLLYWRSVGYTDFKYNRVCIIEGQKFHSSSPCYFGETREEGRLTISYFFQLAK